MKESELELSCRKHVERRYGGRFVKWVSPGTRGVPDRILLLPRCEVVFVELKRPEIGARAAAVQRWWGEWLEKNGFEHWAVNSFAEFLVYCEQWVIHHGADQG